MTLPVPLCRFSTNDEPPLVLLVLATAPPEDEALRFPAPPATALRRGKHTSIQYTSRTRRGASTRSASAVPVNSRLMRFRTPWPDRSLSQ